MKSVLELFFKTGEGKTFKLTLDDPSEDLTTVDIEAAMSVVIAKNPFDIEGGLVEALAANIVTTQIEVIELA